MTTSCKNCNYCKRLYNKIWCGYSSNSLYFCKIKDGMIEVNGICEHYQKKTAEYDLSAERFDKVENDLKYLLERLKDK